MKIMKKNMSVVVLALVFSLIVSSIVTAGGFYRYCPYCGGPIGNCYCYGYQESSCSGYGYNNYSYQENSCSGYGYNEYNEYNEYDYYDYCEDSYEDEEYYYDNNDYSYSGCGYSNSGIQMMHWANMRDACGNIIATVCEGSYISIIGPDCNDSSRTIIYDYTTGCQGSVSTVYIYGGSSYEYENPTEYGAGGCGYGYSEENYGYGYSEENYGYNECQGYGYSEENYDDYSECQGSGYGYGYSEENYNECGYGYSEENYDDYSECQGSEYNYKEGVWVDVDICAQTVNIYNGSTVILSSDCVTGLPGIAETPCGQYYILNKERGSVLSGISPDGVYYARGVDYWMPFTDSGCGFHDATWRDCFGGDIYESYGSYGCVNCEYDFVAQMYDMVDEGCLVNIH